MSSDQASAVAVGVTSDDTKELASSVRRPPAAGMGRPKGALNKTTALLKDAILKAATDAGGGDMAAYLKDQAIANPGPFMALLGKVLPMQVTGDDGADPIRFVHKIERVVVNKADE